MSCGFSPIHPPASLEKRVALSWVGQRNIFAHGGWVIHVSDDSHGR